MKSDQFQIAVVGAGPIGLEAALRGTANGYDVIVIERGEVGANVDDWGHVKLFSPFELNSTELGLRAVIEANPNATLPANDELLTGRKFLDRYLKPIANTPKLCGRVREHTEVLAIGRSRFWKGDQIGQQSRASDRFVLMVRDVATGNQQTVQADFVLDCSGTYPNHNWIGAGGIPCAGESDVLDSLDYHLPDVCGARRQEFAGRRTMVIGGGFSAATSIVALAELAKEVPGTSAVWITRSDRNPPMNRIEDDTLCERARLVDAANQLALGNAECSHVDRKPSRSIDSIQHSSQDETFLVKTRRLDVGLDVGEEFVVDRVIANVGYRPDRRLYEELQVHECYASGGPIKLAAALLGETSTDCLSQSGHGAEVLRNPEPRFFILGSKSYGRDSRFLMKIGFEQIRDVYELIAADLDAAKGGTS